MSFKFSIGVPAYKSKFLEECIISVLRQTYLNYELIIVNDFSPNPIKEIVDSFQDDRIIYYCNDKNIGALNVVDNWNICLGKATGDYFVLMGDDDKMEPNFLEEFVKLINRYPDLDVYHCRSLIINDKSEPVLYTPSWPEIESVYESMWHRFNFHREQYISDFVYKTKTLKRNGGFYKLPLAWASDDVSAYIASGTKGIAHTNKPVFNYRKSPLTISNTGNLEIKMKAILEEELWVNKFLENEPDSLQDKIVYEGLKNGTVKLFYVKKKRKIFYHAARQKKIKQLFYWFFRLKKIDVGYKDWVFGILGKI